jgi:hypothetical protein
MKPDVVCTDITLNSLDNDKDVRLFDLVEHRRPSGIKYKVRVRSPYQNTNKDVVTLDNEIMIRKGNEHISSVFAYIETDSKGNLLIIYISFVRNKKVFNTIHILKQIRHYKYYTIYDDTYESDAMGKFMCIDKTHDEIYHIYQQRVSRIKLTPCKGKEGVELSFECRSNAFSNCKQSIVWLTVKDGLIGLAHGKKALAGLSVYFQQKVDDEHFKLIEEVRSNVECTYSENIYNFSFDPKLNTFVISTNSEYSFDMGKSVVRRSKLILERFNRSKKHGYRLTDSKIYKSDKVGHRQKAISLRPYSLDISYVDKCRAYICSYVDIEGKAYYLIRSNSSKLYWHRTRIEVANPRNTFAHSGIFLDNSAIVYSYDENAPKCSKRHSVIVEPVFPDDEFSDCESEYNCESETNTECTSYNYEKSDCSEQSSESSSKSSSKSHHTKYTDITEDITKWFHFALKAILICLAIYFLYPFAFGIIYYLIYLAYYVVYCVLYLIYYIISSVGSVFSFGKSVDPVIVSQTTQEVVDNSPSFIYRLITEGPRALF